VTLHELLQFAVLGLVVGGLGGLVVPGRLLPRFLIVPALGIVGALVGGLLASLVLSSTLPRAHFGVAAVFCLLVVGGYALHRRSQYLPR
jgi:uncharacterized membrane protein YeaQ/YmgE (transglycosylase-associated protein family)